MVNSLCENKSQPSLYLEIQFVPRIKQTPPRERNLSVSAVQGNNRYFSEIRAKQVYKCTL